jgi:hypothetical protein
MATMKEMIDAIHSNPLVGRGSCSTVDECMDAIEIQEALESQGIGTVEAAVHWAIQLEAGQMERMMDQRWGEDDDPQVDIKNDWEARKAAHLAGQT